MQHRTDAKLGKRHRPPIAIDGWSPEEIRRAVPPSRATDRQPPQCFVHAGPTIAGAIGLNIPAVMKRAAYGVILFTGLVRLALGLWLGFRPFDDTYITFRYALNLASGFGFVYNVGESVLGTTAP